MTEIDFELNGVAVSTSSDGSLLDALRERFGVRSVKDGCSPQGQCGCCTVWVDGQPRVSCVTPVARVAGRRVTTIEGLGDLGDLADAFASRTASQCGFCTPGILMRIAALDDSERAQPDRVRKSLLGHLCRCTGWQTIVEATTESVGVSGRAVLPNASERADQRAAIEGRVDQTVGVRTALGDAGFADDGAPADALVAMLTVGGDWVVGETVAEARALSGKVQGRRTSAPLAWPIDIADDGFVRTLRTTWVEPGYLEPDASWCAPGGVPRSALGNGGAFGGKANSPVSAVARELADRHGRAVRVLYTREDVVRRGPKRPPVAMGIRSDGSGVIRYADGDAVAAQVAEVQARWPQFRFEPVSVLGPPVSLSIRAALDAELQVLIASLQHGPEYRVVAASGAVASARLDDDRLSVEVDCGEVVDPSVLRSYCIGAAHMAIGWVRSEGLAVTEEGTPADLTIRSFGILRASEIPTVDVDLVASERAPVNGSDAVFAAVAAAAWASEGFPPRWPVQRVQR